TSDRYRTAECAAKSGDPEEGLEGRDDEDDTGKDASGRPARDATEIAVAENGEDRLNDERPEDAGHDRPEGIGFEDATEVAVRKREHGPGRAAARAGVVRDGGEAAWNCLRPEKRSEGSEPDGR